MPSACSERLAIGAMGTRFELAIGEVAGSASAGRVRAIGEEALGLIREWHDRLDLFDRGSLLSWINGRAGQSPGEWVGVDREMAGLLGLCAGLWRETGGAFDPSVGAVMRRAGLQERAGVGGGQCADAPWGFGNVEVDEVRARVRFTRAGIELDLGAIAKGFVLDLVGERLRDAGVTSALIHGGTSSVLAIGGAPDGRKWTVALGDGDGARVGLADRAMSVSAGRMTEGVGRVAHVVDPRTGEVRVRNAQASACVIGGQGATCEAWSTALLVLGDRPAMMDERLTCAVREGEGDPWRIAGDEVWRFSNIREGVSAA